MREACVESSELHALKGNARVLTPGCSAGCVIGSRIAGRTAPGCCWNETSAWDIVGLR